MASCLKNPGRIVENKEIEDKLELKHGIIERLTGIKRRYYITERESLHSLASDACQEVIFKSGINPSDIDLMIFYTEVPTTYREGSVLHKRYYELSAHIQHALKKESLDISCECINLSGSCVVFISALQIATSLIKCGYKKNVVIIGAANNSTFLNEIDKNVFMAFGDGASATIVTESEQKGFIDFFRMTDSDGFNAGYFENYDTLIIDRKRVAEFAPVALKLAVEGILKKTNLKIEEIDLIIPHQAGDRIINKGMELCEIPANKVYLCLENYGNTGSPSVQIALSNALEDNRIKRGDLVLLVAFGIGWNYGSTIFQF